jgi:hypothetical protein
MNQVISETISLHDGPLAITVTAITATGATIPKLPL